MVAQREYWSRQEPCRRPLVVAHPLVVGQRDIAHGLVAGTTLEHHWLWRLRHRGIAAPAVAGGRFLARDERRTPASSSVTTATNARRAFLNGRCKIACPDDRSLASSYCARCCSPAVLTSRSGFALARASWFCGFSETLTATKIMQNRTPTIMTRWQVCRSA
jgi:hypothetical protein